MENEDRRSLAPVTLSTHYLELGRAIVKELYDDKSMIATKNFNLTNNLENDVTINWIEGKINDIQTKDVKDNVFLTPLITISLQWTMMGPNFINIYFSYRR